MQKHFDIIEGKITEVISLITLKTCPFWDTSYGPTAMVGSDALFTAIQVTKPKWCWYLLGIIRITVQWDSGHFSLPTYFKGL